MEATAFKESNTVLDSSPYFPIGKSALVDRCSPIDAFVGKLITGEDIVVTCWKLTAADLERIQQSGRIWLLIFGSPPPILPQASDPFEEWDDKRNDENDAGGDTYGSQ